MDTALIELHLRLGKEAGIEKTCGKKIDYKSEATAIKAANGMNKKNP